MLLSKEKDAPSMSDGPESSVLFSLRELRRREDERLQAEADARRAQAEAARRAMVEAEQRARDEATRRARDEEERRRRAENEREARLREDQLRLEEAERRARVEGELKLKERLLLAEQRQRHLHGRRAGRPAWMAVAAGAALSVAVGAGVAARAARQHDAEKKALEQEVAEARAAQLDFAAKIRALELKAHRDVAAPKTTNDEGRILGDPRRHEHALDVTRPRPPRRTAPAPQPTAAAPKALFRVPQKPEINDDPLAALPAVNSGNGF